MNKIVRQDGYINMLSGLGTPGLDRSVMGSFFGGGWRRGLERYWATRNSLHNLGDYYVSHGIAQTIIDRPANDCFQRGVDIEGDDDEAMEDEYDRLNVLTRMADAVRWSRLYGGAALLLIARDGGEFTDPLNLDTLETIDEIKVYDITCIRNTGRYYQDITDINTYGTIEFYNIASPGMQAFDVHETRLIPVTGDPLPHNFINVTGLPWIGRSVLEGCLVSLERYYQAMDWASRLIERKQQGIYNMNGLGEMFANGDDHLVQTRINMVDLVRSNLNSIVIDKDDEYKIENLGLDGLQSLLDSFEVALASDARMPVVVLFGKATRGLNQTGAGDLESYYGMIGQIQQIIVRPALEKLTSILYVQRSFTGSIPPDWHLEFNPLWQPTEQEQANADQAETLSQQQKVNTLITLMTNEILSPEEVRKIVVSDVYPDFEFPDKLPPGAGNVNYAQGVDTSMLNVPGSQQQQTGA